MSRLLLGVRAALLVALMAFLGAQLAQPTYAEVEPNCNDCGCPAGFNGCCLLPNGSVCLKAG